MARQQYYRQWYLKNRERVLQLEKEKLLLRTPEQIEERKQYRREYYLKNREKLKSRALAYNHNNKEKISEKSRKYYVLHQDRFINKEREKRALETPEQRQKRLSVQRAYYASHKEKLLKYDRERYPARKKILAEQARERTIRLSRAEKERRRLLQKKWRTLNKQYLIEYERMRFKLPQRKLRTIITTRINHILHGRTKSKYLFQLFGYDVENLISHIQKQFVNGMTWNNHGKYWHIDPRIPLSWFDLTTPEGMRNAFSLQNMQPKLAKKNLNKGNRYAEPTLLQIAEVHHAKNRRHGRQI